MAFWNRGVVDSVFSRRGTVLAAANDYDIAKINGLTAALSLKADVASSNLYVVNFGLIGEGSQVFTDMGASFAELNTRSRWVMDCRNATRSWISVSVGGTPGSAGSILQVQYSIDAQANWSNLCSVAIDAAASVKGTPVAFPSDGKIDDCWFRLGTAGGNGVTDPSVRMVYHYIETAGSFGSLESPTLTITGNTTLTKGVHQGYTLICTTALTLTVNASTDFDPNDGCVIIAQGGTVTITASGATVNAPGSDPLSIGRYGSGIILGTSTADTFILNGWLGA